MYEFFKRSIEKQKTMFTLIKGFIEETNEQMYKNREQTANNRDEADTILNFLKPYSSRFDFCLREVGLPEDTCFEVYLLYRTFINPDLVGFTASNLHQYHILF